MEQGSPPPPPKVPPRLGSGIGISATASFTQDNVEAKARKAAMLLLGIAGALLTISLLAIGLARPSGTISEPAPTPDAPPPPSISVPKEEAQLQDPLLDAELKLELPFGRRAEIACMEKCKQRPANEIEELCAPGCHHLITGEYARRILPKDLDAQALAKQSIEQCQKREVLFPQNPTYWKESADTALDALKRYSAEENIFDARTALEKVWALEAVRKSLSVPETDEEKGFVAKIEQVLCMREAIAATQLAIAQTGSSGDTFSEAFYREYEEVLLREIKPFESKLRPEPRAASVKKGAKS